MLALGYKMSLFPMLACGHSWLAAVADLQRLGTVSADHIKWLGPSGNSDVMFLANPSEGQALSLSWAILPWVFLQVLICEMGTDHLGSWSTGVRPLQQGQS